MKEIGKRPRIDHYLVRGRSKLKLTRPTNKHESRALPDMAMSREEDGRMEASDLVA